jgi:hypothetical protein
VKLAATRSRVGILLAIGLVSKLVWEAIGGPIPLTQSSAGGPVVTPAHLYGALAGAAVGLVGVARRRRDARRRNPVAL